MYDNDMEECLEYVSLTYHAAAAGLIEVHLKHLKSQVTEATQVALNRFFSKWKSLCWRSLSCLVFFLIYLERAVLDVSLEKSKLNIDVVHNKC